MLLARLRVFISNTIRFVSSVALLTSHYLFCRILGVKMNGG